MIIVMKRGADDAQIGTVTKAIEDAGLKVHLSKGETQTVIGAVGNEAAVRSIPFEAMNGVETVTPIQKPYQLAGKELHPEPSVFDLAPGIPIGGKHIVTMSGPCSVEPGGIMMEVAKALKQCGVQVLRGGAFKPRTSPYDFQGMGEDGLKLMAEARDETGLALVTEVMDPRDVELVCRYVDIMQIGARNMQNFTLLKEVGLADKPVLLKRGLSSTYKEWFMAAEYVMSQGNRRVMLCERGIRSYDQTTRNLFDAVAVSVAKDQTHLPVVVDPSHAGGARKWVEPISKAAVAIGCDGLIIESHPEPAKALSDGAQMIALDQVPGLLKILRPIAEAVGRTI